MTRRRSIPVGLPAVAVAYLRTSTTEQTLGLEAQRAAIEAHAARNGWTVAAWHSEHESGTLAAEDRPELLAALGSIEAHRAGLLVVARRDRLARDVVVARVVERMAERAGARVVSIAGEGSEDAGPSGQFLRTIIDAAAQFEVASLRARTRAGLAVRRSKGLRVGGVPFGYRVADGGRLELEPREQATLQRVAELLDIGHTVDELAATLRREGHRSRNGGPLSRSRVGALCTQIKRDSEKNRT